MKVIAGERKSLIGKQKIRPFHHPLDIIIIIIISVITEKTNFNIWQRWTIKWVNTDDIS